MEADTVPWYCVSVAPISGGRQSESEPKSPKNEGKEKKEGKGDCSGSCVAWRGRRVLLVLCAAVASRGSLPLDNGSYEQEAPTTVRNRATRGWLR